MQISGNAYHVTIKGILYFVFQTLANANSFVLIAARFVEFARITESFTICTVDCLMTMMATTAKMTMTTMTMMTSFQSGQAALLVINKSLFETLQLDLTPDCFKIQSKV